MNMRHLSSAFSSDTDGFRRLATAVILRAVKDKDANFLTPANPMFRHWCAVAGVNPNALNLENRKCH